MVTFTCNGCGNTLKKKQVETHRQRCNNSHAVSCIDCLKDFYGEEYDAHIKCISEAQRYGGVDAEAPVEKGALKQQQWMKTVQAAIDNATGVNEYERSTLQNLTKYDNLPRKKNKFVNFMKNSVKIRNDQLVEKMWNIFETAMKASSESGKTGEEKPKENEGEPNGKLSKKEKRKDGVEGAEVEEDGTGKPKKNRKKKDDLDRTIGEEQQALNGDSEKPKKNKKKEDDLGRTIGEEQQALDGDSEKPKKDKKKKKRDSESVSVKSDGMVVNDEEMQAEGDVDRTIGEEQEALDGDSKKPKKDKKKKKRDSEPAPVKSNDLAVNDEEMQAEDDVEKQSKKKKKKGKDESVTTDNIETVTPENRLAEELVNGDEKILSKKEKRKKRKEQQKLADGNIDEVVVNGVDAGLNGTMEVEEPIQDVPRNLSKKERKKMAKRLAQEQEEAKREAEGKGDEEETNQKLSKKEKRRRQREDSQGEQTGVKNAFPDGKDEEEPVPGKKKGKKNKKRMLSGSEASVNAEEVGMKKNKKQKAELTNGDVNGHGAHADSLEIKGEEAEDEEEPSATVPRKFRWDKAIKTALKECSESEMSVKKLKKKVLAHYIEMGGEGKGEVSIDDLSATFNYKLSHNPKFKVFKDKVSLTSK